MLYCIETIKGSKHKYLYVEASSIEEAAHLFKMDTGVEPKCISEFGAVGPYKSIIP